MSGIEFLLDTNIIIGFITRIELLSYPTIENQEAKGIKSILETMQHLPMTTAIEDMTIEIRCQYGLKIPDAIIAATAKIHNLTLITLDKQLANRMTDIIG